MTDQLIVALNVLLTIALTWVYVLNWRSQQALGWDVVTRFLAGFCGVGIVVSYALAVMHVARLL